MSVLIKEKLVSGLHNGNIVVDPLRPEHINPNSIDLTLADYLLVYRPESISPVLDPRCPPKTHRIPIPDNTGAILRPGRLYLGCTVETTASRLYVPKISGKSSLGRLGIGVHVTAGFGDFGFVGRWTLELTAVCPVRVFAGMRICQISYETVHGIPEISEKYAGKYQYQTRATPSVPYSTINLDH